MGVGDYTFIEIEIKVIETLNDAKGVMSADNICTELLNAGYPKILQIDGVLNPLNSLVNEILDYYLNHSKVIVGLKAGFIYLPLISCIDLQECQAQIASVADQNFVLLPHYMKMLGYLKAHPDIISWAEVNKKNKDREVRFFSYLFLLHVTKMDKYVSEAATDNDARIKCLAIANIYNADDAGAKKIAALMNDEDYAELILSLNFNHDELLIGFTKMASSNHIEDIIYGIKGIMKERRFEGIPVLIDGIGGIEIENYLSIFDETFELEIETHIKHICSRQGKLPPKVRDQLIDQCNSKEFNVQKYAFMAMENKWLKSDVPNIEKINTDSSDVATGLKLKALYKKDSPNCLTIAESYLSYPHSAFRNTVVEVMGVFGSKAEKSVLMRIFSDENERDKFDLTILLKAIKKL
jgi:hypothetical protein